MYVCMCIQYIRDGPDIKKWGVLLWSLVVLVSVQLPSNILITLQQRFILNLTIRPLEIYLKHLQLVVIALQQQNDNCFRGIIAYKETGVTVSSDL